jgi:RNA polymerase sigma-70 factor (ECF subfamily)
MEITAEKKPLRDEEVIALVLNGETNMYGHIMRKYNQRLFRVCKGILHDDKDAEDALQEGYIKAYQQMSSFRGESAFSTWLTRIVINQALKKNKENQRFLNDSGSSIDNILSKIQDMHTPHRSLIRKELKANLEKCITSLPETYRLVYMMREVEKMSVAETSACLNISEVNVKVRLNRAKEKLREKLSEIYSEVEVFEFHLTRCNRIVENVLARIAVNP